MGAFLDRLERKFGRYAVPQVTVMLVAGQAIAFVMSVFKLITVDSMLLVPELVLRGQVWRLFSFVFIPPNTHPVFILFALYVFYLMGSALESRWGAFRYNMFLLVGYLATIAAAFIVRTEPSSVAYLGGMVFLAFAWMFPDFELYLFFLLPVKVKWLALVTWCLYIIQLLFGGWRERLLVLAAIANFLLFFGRDIFYRVRAGRYRMATQARRVAVENEPRHKCAVCGVSDRDNPELDFRYCTECDPPVAYCPEHINHHEHRRTEGTDA